MKKNFVSQSLYPWIAENLFLRAGDQLLNTSFVPELKKWREIPYWNSAEIQDLQQQRLAHLLNHISHNIPFYKTYSATPNQSPYDWLRELPVMRKSDIKSNLKDLIDCKATNLIVEKSSGSSGIQGEIYMTRQEQYRAIAIQTALWEWSGYKLGMPILQLGMTLQRSRIKSLKDQLLRTSYQQAFDINKSAVETVFQHFKQRNGFFGGYASGLYSYALLAEELNLQDIHFEAVISWGDKMFPHYRSKIEKQFNTKVFDIYGTTEGFVIAGQCEHHRYHVLTPHVLLEILDENGKEVAPGELGYVVVTRLDAFAMPLVRYYLGDLAVKASEQEHCPCGRGLPILEKIIGRDTDIVRTRSGKMLIVHFFTGIFEHIPEIIQFKVIQKDLDSITIEYIPNSSLFKEEVLKKIEIAIHEKVKEPFLIRFQNVSKIEPTSSGKPQIILSLLDKPVFT